MARVAVIGEPLRIHGYGLPDAILCPATDQAEAVLAWRELPDDIETVVLVGHNPGIEDLASFLTGESVAMPTSALAVITWPGPWAAAGRDSAVLRASGRPPAQ